MATQGNGARSLEELAKSPGNFMRLRALKTLPPEIGQLTLEASPVPIIIYCNNSVAYANPACLERFGYTFKELKTFDNATLDTGNHKKRIDTVLNTCASKGWHELDLEIRTGTLDTKELILESKMSYFSNGENGYWTAYILRIDKIDPSTVKAKASKWVQRMLKVFQRDIIYFRCPEYVDKAYIVGAVKTLAATLNNLVLDFKKTRKIDKDALELLCEAARTCKDDLFLVNTNRDLYYIFQYQKVPSATIYRPRNFKIDLVTS